MTFEEQSDFREWLRGGLQRVAPLERTRVLVEEDRRTDTELWSGLNDLGVLGLGVPEEYGGSDAGMLALSIFLSEAGRVLLPAAYLSTGVLAPWILRSVEDEELRQDLLPRIAVGEIRVGFADRDAEASGSSPASVRTVSEGEFLLSGVKNDVLDGDACDYFFVTVRTNAGESLFLADASDRGIAVERLRNLDETRPVSSVSFTDVAVRPVATSGTAAGLLASTRALLGLALAAEGAGSTSRCLDVTVDFVKMRHQFGRPIGQFQAIKHKCADMFVETQATAAAVHSAFSSLDDTGTINTVQAKVAAEYVSSAFVSVAAQAMQLHGGMAFTWEQEIHLYLKRAKADQLLLGGADHQIASLADDLIDGGKTVLALIGGEQLN